MQVKEKPVSNAPSTGSALHDAQTAHGWQAKTQSQTRGDRHGRSKVGERVQALTPRGDPGPPHMR